MVKPLPPQGKILILKAISKQILLKFRPGVHIHTGNYPVKSGDRITTNSRKYTQGKKILKPARVSKKAPKKVEPKA